MNPRTLLVATGVLEAAAGAALLLVPSLSISFFLGSAPDLPGVVVARVAGAAVLALGAICWVMRREGRGRATRAVVAGMLVYDVGVLAVFLHAGLALRLPGIGLWLGAVLHFAMGLWCVACLRGK